MKKQHGRVTKWTSEEEGIATELLIKGLKPPAIAKIMPDKSVWDIRRRRDLWDRNNVNLTEKYMADKMVGESF